MALALPCIYLYEKYIEKPRIRPTATEPILAAGWTKWTAPTQQYSVGVPPGFIILDPSRPDFKESVAELKKADPKLAAYLTKSAKEPAPPEGFIAFKPGLSGEKVPHVSMCKVWVEHARSLISLSDSSIKEMGEAIAMDSPKLRFGPMFKVKTPATEAFMWSGSGKYEAGVPVSQTDIAFIDKWDAFYVQISDIPGQGPPPLAEPIAQTFREYKPHTGWEGGR